MPLRKVNNFNQFNPGFIKFEFDNYLLKLSIFFEENINAQRKHKLVKPDFLIASNISLLHGGSQ